MVLVLGYLSYDEDEPITTLEKIISLMDALYINLDFKIDITIMSEEERQEIYRILIKHTSSSLPDINASWGRLKPLLKEILDFKKQIIFEIEFKTISMEIVGMCEDIYLSADKETLERLYSVFVSEKDLRLGGCHATIKDESGVHLITDEKTEIREDKTH